MSKEIPILFSTPMVEAIIQGRKIMTRRIISSQFNEYGDVQYSKAKLVSDPELCDPDSDEIIPKQFFGLFCEFDNGEWCVKCPYGKVGDILWVRECWKWEGHTSWKDLMRIGNFLYKADKGSDIITGWKPSIHMPKEACRLKLEITDIKIEQLQTISEHDAIAEGIEIIGKDEFTGINNYKIYTALNSSTSIAAHSFETLWKKINGIKSWDQSPWVWVVSFKVIKK